MSIPLFHTIISLSLLIFSILWVYRLLGTHFILTLPGYFYIHFIIFIFIGSPFIFLKHGAYNYIYIISTHLVLLIFPLGILITNKLMVIDHPDLFKVYLNKPITDNQSGSQFNILYFIVLGISILVTVLYFYKLEIIPINYLIKSISEQLDYTVLAKLREAATTTFKFENLHRYRFFMAQMIPFLVIVAYLKVKMSNHAIWSLIFYLMIVLTMYRSISDLQKAPIIHFIILLFLMSWIYYGKINWKQVGILIAIIISLLILMFIFIMGSDQNSSIKLLQQIGKRIFLTQTGALYYYFSLFPSLHDFLYGTSLPNPAGLFQFEHFPITKWVFVNGFNRNWEIVGTAPSAFIGEIYANFGCVCMILSVLLLSMLLQFIQIQFITKPRTLLLMAYYIYFVFLSAQFALTSVFLVIHPYLFIFLLTAIFFVDGYKVLAKCFK